MGIRVYAYFYQRLSNGKLVQKLGTDGRFRLDARWGYVRTHANAADMCKRRGFAAYHVESETSDHALLVKTDVYSVEHKTDLGTVSSRINSRQH